MGAHVLTEATRIYCRFTFNKVRVDHLLPTMLALNVCPIVKVAGYEVPPFAVDFDEPLELFVLQMNEMMLPVRPSFIRVHAVT